MSDRDIEADHRRICEMFGVEGHVYPDEGLMTFHAPGFGSRWSLQCIVGQSLHEVLIRAADVCAEMRQARDDLLRANVLLTDIANADRLARDAAETEAREARRERDEARRERDRLRRDCDFLRLQERMT